MKEQDARSGGRGRGRGGRGGKGRGRGRGRSKAPEAACQHEGTQQDISEPGLDAAPAQPKRTKRSKHDAGTPEPPEAKKKAAPKKRPLPDAHETNPTPKAKAKAKAKATGKKPANHEAAEVADRPDVEIDLEQDAPRPKAKAKATSKDKDADAADKPVKVKDPEAKARYSRKSAAYHRKKTELLQQGADKETALAAARKVRFHSNSCSCMFASRILRI